MGVTVRKSDQTSAINSNIIAMKRDKITDWHLRFVKIISGGGVENGSELNYRRLF